MKRTLLLIGLCANLLPSFELAARPVLLSQTEVIELNCCYGTIGVQFYVSLNNPMVDGCINEELLAGSLGGTLRVTLLDKPAIFEFPVTDFTNLVTALRNGKSERMWAGAFAYDANRKVTGYRSCGKLDCGSQNIGIWGLQGGMNLADYDIAFFRLVFTEWTVAQEHSHIAARWEVYGTRSNPRLPRQAIASAWVVNGFVVGARLTDSGNGYTNPPLVQISGGGGSGAAGYAVMEDGAVTEIKMTSAGVGYTNSPKVLISRPPMDDSISRSAQPSSS